ncbi:MAG TPA: AAA family ATPase, partial [Stenomitos sp.]
MAIVSSHGQPSLPEKMPPSVPPDLETDLQEGAAMQEAKSASRASMPSLIRPEAGLDEQRGQNDEKLRPQRLAEYIGQRELKDVLNITIQAAQSRQEPLDHLLLYGPPGLGKTTISLILAQEMGVQCKVTSAPALERPRDIVGLLMNLQRGDILFIDEIHRLSRMTEELLYPAMEDFRLDITIGNSGCSSRSPSNLCCRFRQNLNPQN